MECKVVQMASVVKIFQKKKSAKKLEKAKCAIATGRAVV